ncbi:MAG: helix-turn-helix transcriptional regulator [Roseburia sp.]|nr:helix-turn-helix transcriptional regulator [Roseburia sp.]
MCDSKRIQIGEQIKYYRTLKNMSQESLALLAGVNPAFVGQIERGMKSPTVNTLQKIAGALEISLAELFTPKEMEDGNTSGRELELRHIQYLLRDLSDEDVAAVTRIVTEIVKIKHS